MPKAIPRKPDMYVKEAKNDLVLSTIIATISDF